MSEGCDHRNAACNTVVEVPSGKGIWLCLDCRTRFEEDPRPESGGEQEKEQSIVSEVMQCKEPHIAFASRLLKSMYFRQRMDGQEITMLESGFSLLREFTDEIDRLQKELYEALAGRRPIDYNKGLTHAQAMRVLDGIFSDDVHPEYLGTKFVRDHDSKVLGEGEDAGPLGGGGEVREIDGDWDRDPNGNKFIGEDVECDHRMVEDRVALIGTGGIVSHPDNRWYCPGCGEFFAEEPKRISSRGNRPVEGVAD